MMGLASGAMTSAQLLGGRQVLRSYWFRPGGEISLGVCRIAIYAALLHSLIKNYSSAAAVEAHLSTVSAAVYIPKGVLSLFGRLPPSADIMVAVWWVAYAGCILAIVGLFTRPAMVLSTISTVALLSLWESFGVAWSHGYNVNALAALAFMFAPAGASLSLDRLVSRVVGWRPLGLPEAGDSFYWGVLAAQLAVALFYFAGFWSKIYNGGLAWAFSDNMRMMLAMTWEHPYFAVARPWHIGLLMENPFLWQAAAVVHLLTQALPLLAAFHIHRPAVRLLEGTIFVAGVYGLYLVMSVWDPQWFWLGAVFVDWEWAATRVRALIEHFSPRAGSRIGAIAGRLRPLLVPASYAAGRHGGNPPPPAALQPSLSFGQRTVAGYLLVFFGYYAAIFVFQVRDYRHNNYPFSAFDFYSENYSLPPYDEHKHFTLMAGGIRFSNGDCADLDRKFPRVFKCADGVSEYSRNGPN
jgi:hypothetical protein